MEALSASYAAVAEPLRAFGDALLAVANPDLDRDTRIAATASVNYWGTLDFDVALWLALGYLMIVAGGVFLRPAAVAGGAEGKKDKVVKPIAQKFREEPILYLQFIYNWVQVALCGYMMVTAAQVAISRGYTLLCNKFDAKPRDNDLLNVLWLFYVSKILDFADTCFMIIRGGWAQFTFLHTYHHTSIFLVYWMVTSAAYDGDVYYTIVANSFIHFIMYAYYGLTTVNVPIREFGWVVTNAQLFQFVTMMFQACVILFFPGCTQYPRNVTWFYLFYIASLFALFSDFKAARFGGKKGQAAKPAGSGATSPTLAEAARAKESFDAAAGSTTAVNKGATEASKRTRGAK